MPPFVFAQMLSVAALTLLICLALVVVASPTKRQVIRAPRLLLQTARTFAERRYLQQRLKSRFVTLATWLVREFSNPNILTGLALLTLFTGCLLHFYRNETRPIYALFLLAPLGLMPAGMLAVLFCGKPFVAKILDCPFCVLIRWTLLAALIWLGHAITTEQLSETFGGASVHLPVAYAAGTFLNFVGFLSIPTALLLFLSEVLVVVAFCIVDSKDLGVSRTRWLTAFTVAILAVAQLSIGVGAQGVAGSYSMARLIVADIAYQEDMLDAKLCTDKKSPYRIAYFDGDQSRAFAFRDPASPTATNGGRPLRLLKASDLATKLPSYAGTLSCNYRPVPSTLP